MNKAVLGLLAGAGIVIATVGAPDRHGEVFAQRLAPQHAVGSADQLIAVPGPLGDKGQLVTVIDPKLRAMAVYQIDQAAGTIKLLSVRNIQWDLQMTYLNNEGLLPQEIRSGLQELEPRQP